MSYARFTTHESAQAYADACQQYLVESVGPAYISPRWSDVMTGSDGAFYVNLLQSFPPNTDDIVPDVPVSESEES